MKKNFKKPTIHQVVHENGGRTASILWPVTGMNRHIRWNFPEVLALPGENQTLKMLKYGSALWILQTELCYGRQRKSVHQPDLDDYAALLTQKLLLKRRPPDLITLHLVDCDEMRHEYGADSREASLAIRRLDSRVGILMKALEKKGAISNTVVALVSDHGLCDVDRPVCLEHALREAGFHDVCRAQSTGMGAYIIFSGKGEEKAQQVRLFLEENMKRLGILRVYGRDDLAFMGAGRDIRLAVEAAPGIVFVDDLALEKRVKATHGFGPNNPAAKCLFIMAGPGIRKGVSIPSMSMTDIAPTLLHAMGLSMPSAQGKMLAECFE
jgi:predicted AlkP superfamily pyrophosphatase or phosphodiesterase